MDARIYIDLHGEIEWQARLALTTADDMEAALERRDAVRAAAEKGAAEHRFWCAAQTFLSASANISKLLMTPRNRDAAEERELLRKQLNVANGSPLIDRKLRNHFEHYDERMIKLARDHPDSGSIDAHFGHPSEYGPYAHHVLRCFDPQGRTFWFYGEQYPLEPWVQALRDVRAMAQETRLF